MKRFTFSLLAAVGMFAGASALQAQSPYVTYYQPSTVFYAPAVTTSPYTVASPVVVPTPAPTVTYYRAPVYQAPAVSYYPAAPVITRYRPLLGTRVVRYPYRYSAPVVYYP
jgi:hypothetical protein